MPRYSVRLGVLTAVAAGLVACSGGEADEGGSSADSVATEASSQFCNVARTYAAELVGPLEDEANQGDANSPLNTSAFWNRYKELQTEMRDLAPAEIRSDAQLAYESAMAAYEYMEQFGFSMERASVDPSFAEDERFTDEKYLRAGVKFQAYIDENCAIAPVE